MKKIFLIISILTAFLLVGCNKNVVENNNTQNISSGESNVYLSGEIVQNENIEKVVKKVDENKDIVYKIFERQLNVEDTDLNLFRCEYPYINIDSKEVEMLNDKISGYIEEAKKIEDSIDASCPSYYTSINDNILTVVLGIKPGIGVQFTGEICSLLVDEVYNIDIYTGKLLSDEEVLEITNNISINDIDMKMIYNEMYIDNSISAAFRDEFRENGNLFVEYDVSDEASNKAYKEYLDYYAEKTLEDIPWFIDDNKNVIAEMYYYTPFGATDGSRIILQVNITEMIKGRDYMIENSDKELFRENELYKGHYPELDEFSNSELNIAYNEIFARHGHDFKSENLKEYFSEKVWYHPIEGKQVTIEELNDIERENARIIKEEIASRRIRLENYNK